MTDVLKTLLGKDMPVLQTKYTGLCIAAGNHVVDSILHTSQSMEIEKLHDLSFLIDRFIPFNAVTKHKLVIVCDPVVNQLINRLVQLEIRKTYDTRIKGRVFLCLVSEEHSFGQKVYLPIQCFDVQPIIEQKIKIKSPLLKGLFE